jgi:alpha-glucosidase
VAADPAQWWRDAVVYQIYPRSFQDSDGDGVGDIAGIASRLDHLEWLGVDAIWLSPIYPSPGADLGYDVSDHVAVDPLFGGIADLDALIAECHGRGIRVLLDLVVSHTSIEHPWFREHPDWYVWASGERPPNNWLAAFGGPAWTRDERTGGWYLHSFYPEQPDLDWRNPEVREAVAGVVRFWRERGVDGFRLDAIERAMKDRELRDDPLASGPPPLPMPEHLLAIDQVRSRNDPEIAEVLATIRTAAGADAFLVGEVYLATAQLAPYLADLDVAFGFELLHSDWDAARLRSVVAAASELGGVAWVLSNHDFPRLATRLGARAARGAAVLLLSLPGTAFVYQGDEIGMADGPQGEPPVDRFGRDAHRNPMQWDGSPTGGFTTGKPWLPPADPESRNVADQGPDPRSILALYRRLIELRHELRGELELVDAAPELIAFTRGEHLVAVNAGDRPAAAPAHGEVLLSTDGLPAREVQPGEGLIALREV